MERTILMVGSFRRGEAGDPGIYTAAVAKVLAGYENDVMDYVTDPAVGLASKSDFLPTIKQIKDACEDRLAVLTEKALRRRDYLEQIAQPLPIADMRPKEVNPNLIGWQDLPPDYRPIGRFENPERKAKLA
jgi:hypothetical protein